MSAKVLIVVSFIFDINCLLNITSENSSLLKIDIGKNLSSKCLPENCTVQLKPESKTKTNNSSKTKTYQIGKVSRKQYEIVNMLWMKTNICVDIETNTDSSISTAIVHTSNINNIQKNINRRYQRQDYSKTSIQLPKLLSSTQSHIEFYYFDETDSDFKHRTASYGRVSGNAGLQNKGKNPFNLVSESPIFAIRINDETYISPTEMIKPVMVDYNIATGKSKTSLLNGEDNKNNRILLDKFTHKSSVANNLETNLDYSTMNKAIEVKSSEQNFSSVNINLTSFYAIANQSSIDETNTTKLTTLYDRIKFFEMYDSDTQKPLFRSIKLPYATGSENFVKNHKDVEQKVLLEHVDQSMEEIDSKMKSKFAKKHIIEDNKIDYLNKTLNKDIDDRSIKLNNNLKNDVEGEKSGSSSFIFRNKTAVWAEYPFAALYVYENGQIHCDAAAISHHWLIAAGACLSKHRMAFGLDQDARSAYVTYCGENWSIPERVAYVKNTFVHPGFHPFENTRRRLYNIGVIEVASSMASCTGWAPISLMSHQFSAGPEGSMATAVGWGMNRFDTRYAISDLPKTPLTIFTAMVYTESCPGNVGYSKIKYDDESSVENVYCLSLPPYFGEENDLVHGGILLSGGKLIAVYLQEERRPWGAQSAQYTGTWQLVPWVLDVAREPDEVDAFTIEI